MFKKIEYSFRVKDLTQLRRGIRKHLECYIYVMFIMALLHPHNIIVIFVMWLKYLIVCRDQKAQIPKDDHQGSVSFFFFFFFFCECIRLFSLLIFVVFFNHFHVFYYIIHSYR